MSIKGIDTQIMIARTADFARDTSALQKKPEIAQEYLAVQEKINDAEDETRVAKMMESKLQELRADDEGGGGAAYDGDGDGEGEKRKRGKDDKDMLVPADEHVIDIKV